VYSLFSSFFVVFCPKRFFFDYFKLPSDESAQPFCARDLVLRHHQRRENSRSSSPILDDNDDMTAANQSRPNEETALFLRAIDDVNVQLPF
jgi:hypothetical protein